MRGGKGRETEEEEEGKSRRSVPANKNLRLYHCSNTVLKF